MRTCDQSIKRQIEALGPKPTKPAWLVTAVWDALNDRPMSRKREVRMCKALGLDPGTRTPYYRPCLSLELKARLDGEDVGAVIEIGLWALDVLRKEEHDDH